MKKNHYNISYGQPVILRDRPHREMAGTRSDYGLPSPNETSDNITFSEMQPPGPGVDISQPIIEDVEVQLS